MRISAFMLAAVLSALFPCSAEAVNFYDGARAPKGLYFLTYSSAYTANTVTKIEETLRFCYYSPDWVFTALLPAGSVRSRAAGKSSSGLGDATIGAGRFLPVREADILPMLFVKTPTGEYASDKSTNYGTHQVDIRPAAFIHKDIGKFSIDGAVKYFFRLENDKDISPGDELHLQCLLGCDITKSVKLGPSINWMTSQDKQISGRKAKDSARRTLSVGGELYTKFSGMSFDFNYMYDAFTVNSPRGHFFQVKSCYRF